MVSAITELQDRVQILENKVRVLEKTIEWLEKRTSGLKIIGGPKL